MLLHIVVIHAYKFFLGDFETFLKCTIIFACPRNPMYRIHQLYDTHPFSVPKSAGNMTVQDPNVGITLSKSVNSPTWHHVYGKVVPST